MTAVFWIFALLLTLLAVLLVALPLLRGKNTVARMNASMEEARLVVFQQQVRDLEADLTNRLLDEDQFELARADLERGLLEDSADARAQPGTAGVLSGRVTAAVLALVVPVVALATYLQVGGGVASLEPQRQTAMMAVPGEHEMDKLLTELRARLEQQPSAQGWALLARSLVSLDRPGEALEAYAQAMAAGGDRDPSILAQYADLLGFTGHGLQGRPMELIERALELDPEHPTSLWLAGTAAYQQNDHASARAYWERLLAVMPPDSEEADIIRQNLGALEQ
jgi:cytochrome c-type biogenesis protein CcmH